MNRKEQAIEVSVFLFLIAPSMAFSFFLIKQGSVSFVLTAIASILRDLALVFLILFFLWRNREALSSIGLIFKAAKRNAGLGILLFLPFYFGMGALERSLEAIGFSGSKTPLPSFLDIHGMGEVFLAFILVVVVAIAEEIIFRGYLILRLKAVTGSVTWAVFLSAFIFSLGHGYEGTAGVVTVGIIGVIFGFIYVWRKSLLAPIIMHFLLDFVGIVVIPVLGAR